MGKKKELEKRVRELEIENALLRDNNQRLARKLIEKEWESTQSYRDRYPWGPLPVMCAAQTIDGAKEAVLEDDERAWVAEKLNLADTDNETYIGFMSSMIAQSLNSLASIDK